MPEPVPTPPTRQFAFGTFSVAQPNKPHPGNSLDGEFDRTNLSLRDVIDFVRQAIADDGRIKGDAIPTDAIIVGVGPPGPVGPAFTLGAVDLFANRSVYDAQPAGFSFLAVDTGLVYFRQTVTAGVWSPGVLFTAGEAGPEGATGPAGPAGADGLAGTVLYTIDSGVQNPAVGVDGDLTLRTSDGNLYEKIGGVWTLDGNLRGPQGPQGIQGLQGPTGPVASPASQAEAEAGVENTKFMSSLRVRQAIQILRAGTADAEAATNAIMLMTPLQTGAAMDFRGLKTGALVAGTGFVQQICLDLSLSATTGSNGSLSPNVDDQLPIIKVARGGTIRITGSITGGSVRSFKVFKNGVQQTNVTASGAFSVDITVAAGDTLTFTATASQSFSSGGGTVTVTLADLSAGFSANPGFWRY